MYRLRSSADGTVVPCGFTDSTDASVDDISLWLPSVVDHRTLSVDVAVYLVRLLGDVFCGIVRQEQQAAAWNKLHSTEFL